MEQNPFMVIKATFNNISVISWQSVLLVDKTGVPRENHRPAASHLQIISHNFVSSRSVHIAWAGFELTMLVVIDTDGTGSCNPTTIHVRSRPRQPRHVRRRHNLAWCYGKCYPKLLLLIINLIFFYHRQFLIKGFIIALRNIYQKFIFWRIVIWIWNL